MDRFVRNEYTLKKDVCAHVHEREQCSEAIRESCLKAEAENRQTPEECARSKWMTESEVVALYFRVAGSTYSLLALIALFAVAGMYFTVQYWIGDNQNRRMTETFRDMVQYTRPPALRWADSEHQRPYYLQ